MATNFQKRKKLERHASVRSADRFGVVLTQHEQTEIKKKIYTLAHNGLEKLLDVVVLEKQEKGRTLYAVLYKNEWLPVVYSKKLDCLVTILPKENLIKRSFVPPRPATDEEQKAAFLEGKKIPTIIFKKPEPFYFIHTFDSK